MEENKSRSTLRQVWTNWVGNQSFAPKDTFTAATELEVCQHVAAAVEKGLGVRTFGTGHSFTPIVETAGVLLDTSPMRGILSVDTNRKQVTALPG